MDIARMMASLRRYRMRGWLASASREELKNSPLTYFVYDGVVYWPKFLDYCEAVSKDYFLPEKVEKTDEEKKEAMAKEDDENVPEKVPTLPLEGIVHFRRWSKVVPIVLDKTGSEYVKIMIGLDKETKKDVSNKSKSLLD